MCDYSLEHVASRPARVADRLVATSFINTLTRGFTSPGDPDTAVCLLPGTEIAFDNPPRYRTGFLFGKKIAPGTLARFREINTHLPNAHHDALEFADGTLMPLACLIPGQWATVLQLPSQRQDAAVRVRENGAERRKVAETEMH